MDEFQIIEQYFKQAVCDNDGVVIGIGDDAAVIKPRLGYELVFAADAMVEDRHFTSSFKAYDLGYKSLAVNLSDIAAMGAIPRWFTLSIGLRETSNQWLADFSSGLAGLAQEYNCTLVGGDTVSADKTFISISVIGEVEAGRALLRNGAKEGDIIVLGGPVGFAGDGWRNPHSASARALLHFNRPAPQIELGRFIRPFATSCIDISDGLFSELTHLADASKKKMVVDISQCKKRYWPDLNHQELTRQLSGGEDYVLLFTIERETWMNLVDKNSQKAEDAIIIGQVVEGDGVEIWDGDSALQLFGEGFNHFKGT